MRKNLNNIKNPYIMSNKNGYFKNNKNYLKI